MGEKVCIVVGVLALVAGVVSVVLSCCRPAVPVREPAEVAQVTVEAAAPRVVRVLLQDGAQAVTFSVASSGLWRTAGAESAQGTPIEPGTWQIALWGDGLTLAGRPVGASAILISSADDLFTLGKNSYRGSLVVGRSGAQTLSATNVLPLEQYLCGVVGAEMPPHWPAEALKAQAVAARTYVLHEAQSRTLRTTDLAYTGAGGESAAARRAVRATRGVVVTYEGALFPAYFHSTCGGATVDVEKFFTEPSIPPLEGVGCGWCTRSPAFRWKATLDAEKLAEALGPLGIKQVTSIEPLGAGPDGYARKVLVNGKREIPAVSFRHAVGVRVLKSVAFTVRRHGGKFVFLGRGWGHGVGLCQWGAHGLAVAGGNWQEILHYYYPGAQIGRLAAEPEPAPDPVEPER